MRRVLLLATAVAASCGAFPSEKTVTELSAVCLQAGLIRAQFDTCLSGSCDKLESAQCTVTASGDSALVTGTATIRSQGNDCTLDCRLVTAFCSGGLGASTTVTFGKSTIDRSALSFCEF